MRHFMILYIMILCLLFVCLWYNLQIMRKWMVIVGTKNKNINGNSNNNRIEVQRVYHHHHQHRIVRRPHRLTTPMIVRSHWIVAKAAIVEHLIHCHHTRYEIIVTVVSIWEQMICRRQFTAMMAVKWQQILINFVCSCGRIFSFNIGIRCKRYWRF